MGRFRVASSGQLDSGRQRMSRHLQDVEDFILLSRLDATAARCVRSEVSGIQVAVLGRGVLSGCSNPSSAVMGRIRNAKRSFLSAVAHRDMALDNDRSSR